MLILNREYPYHLAKLVDNIEDVLVNVLMPIYKMGTITYMRCDFGGTTCSSRRRSKYTPLTCISSEIGSIDG